jgi:ribosomal protein S6
MSDKKSAVKGNEGFPASMSTDIPALIKTLHLLATECTRGSEFAPDEHCAWEAADVLKAQQKIVNATTLLSLTTPVAESEAADVIKWWKGEEYESMPEAYVDGVDRTIALIEKQSYELNIAKGSLRNLNQENLNQFKRIVELERANKNFVKINIELNECIAELERLLRMAKSVYRQDTVSDIQWETDKTVALRGESDD